MTKKEMEALSLEEVFQNVDKILKELEEDVSLEQSFEKYNEGMALLKACNDKIDRVEKKVLKLNEEGGLDEF